MKTLTPTDEIQAEFVRHQTWIATFRQQHPELTCSIVDAEYAGAYTVSEVTGIDILEWVKRFKVYLAVTKQQN